MASSRLLLVDDERALLDLLKKYLERLGFSVEACLSPEDALRAFESDPQGYALVLTDLTFPGMNGEQMLERMRTLNPRQRAIISSGYPYEPTSKYTGFLLKPYAPKMLVDLIAKLTGNSAG